MKPIAKWSALSRLQKALLLAVVLVFGTSTAGALLLLSTGGSESRSEETATQISPTHGAQLPDPCILMSLEDAKQVFGKLAIESQSLPLQDAVNCSYRASAGGGGGANDPTYGCPLGLGIKLWSDRALDLAKNEAVTGLGDEAYWVTKVGTPSLWARKGDIRFSIGLSYDSFCEGQTEEALSSKARTTVEMLARTVVSRLG